MNVWKRLDNPPRKPSPARGGRGGSGGETWGAVVAGGRGPRCGVPVFHPVVGLVPQPRVVVADPRNIVDGSHVPSRFVILRQGVVVRRPAGSRSPGELPPRV